MEEWVRKAHHTNIQKDKMSKYGSKSKRIIVRRRRIISKSEENEIENYIKDLDDLEILYNTLAKDSRRLTEAYQNSVRAEEDIVRELMSLSLDAAFRSHLAVWSDSVSKKDEATRVVTHILTKAIDEPVKVFLSFFPFVTAMNKRRDQALEEVTRLQGKVEKYGQKDRRGVTISKYAEYKLSVETARERFDHLNRPQLEMTTKLLDSRIAFIEHSLKVIIQSQVYLYENLRKTSSQVADSFSKPGPGVPSPEDRLSEICSLNIVLDNWTGCPHGFPEL